MPVIAMASSKGGCGKSTTTLILAGAFAADGYRVHILDADRSGRLAKWAAHGAKPDTITASQADEKTLRQQIEDASRSADVVLIDVEGSANLSVALAIGYADAVLIPANLSAPDVEDAVSTVAMIRDMEGAARRSIPHGLVWSRVPTAIRSRETDALAEQVRAGGITIVGAIHDRTAYRSLFSFSTTLDQLPPAEVPGIEKAKAEATALAAAVIELIRNAKPQEAAA